MRKILFILILILCVPFISHAETKKSALYFYSETCPHCQKVNAYFVEQGFYDKYDIQKINIVDQKNQELLTKVFAAKNMAKDTGIPAIVIDQEVFMGDQPIINNFQKTIDASQGTTQDFIASLENNNGSKEKPRIDISIFILLGAALADAANPCALAVLVLLLATVISAKGKGYALLSGFMFSLAIFISYLLMGLGLYKAIAAANVSKYLSIGAGALAILIALANFKDVFWYGKGFIMEVPFSWRPKMQALIRKATNPWSAFGIGFLVSLFLVPCASGPYVAILARLAERVEMTKTLSLLVLYNLIFVSPMIIVTIAMYFFGVRMRNVEEWRQKNLRTMHAVIGTIMFVLGIYLISTRL